MKENHRVSETIAERTDRSRGIRRSEFALIPETASRLLIAALLLLLFLIWLSFQIHRTIP